MATSGTVTSHGHRTAATSPAQPNPTTSAATRTGRVRRWSCGSSTQPPAPRTSSTKRQTAEASAASTGASKLPCASDHKCPSTKVSGAGVDLQTVLLGLRANVVVHEDPVVDVQRWVRGTTQLGD